MANRKEPREAIAEDLRAFAEDVRRLLEDPKKRERRERAWRMLEGAIAVGMTFAARRVAMKLWSLLTGEQPPVRRPGPPPKKTETPPRPETSTVSPEPVTPAVEAPRPGTETQTPATEAPTRVDTPTAPGQPTQRP